MKISFKILAVSIIPLFMLIAASSLSIYLTQSNTQATYLYISRFVDRQTMVSDIYRLLGYGHGIHAFKNYVLRHDPKYQKNALKDMEEAKALISQYQSLPLLSFEEKDAMHILKKTIDEYLSNISLATNLIDQGRSISEVDQAVKVDDTPAIKKLMQLQSHFIKLRSSELANLQKKHEQAFIFMITACLLATLIAILTSQKISRRMIKTIQRLMHISASISHGDYGVKERFLEGLSDDELSSLANQMANMGRNLERSFSQLKKSNADLENFAFIASHDLQEPVKKIATFAELLEIDNTGNLSQNQSLYLEKIRSSSMRMKNLIQRLLDYARLLNTARHFTTIDLNQVVQTALDNLQPQITSKHAKIEIEKLPKITGNFEMMVSLFQNLIGNAIKYAKPNIPPDIHIKVSDSKESPIKAWLIEVYDNGQGFDDKHIPTILKLFGRVHAEHTLAGSGIGLATCQQILSMHNSEFIIKSKVGEGSCFSFYLSLEP